MSLFRNICSQIIKTRVHRSLTKIFLNSRSCKIFPKTNGSNKTLKRRKASKCKSHWRNKNCWNLHLWNPSIWRTRALRLMRCFPEQSNRPNSNSRSSNGRNKLKTASWDRSPGWVWSILSLFSIEILTSRGIIWSMLEGRGWRIGWEKAWKAWALNTCLT